MGKINKLGFHKNVWKLKKNTKERQNVWNLKKSSQNVWKLNLLLLFYYLFRFWHAADQEKSEHLDVTPSPFHFRHAT
jgi:hypothetical protein